MILFVTRGLPQLVRTNSPHLGRLHQPRSVSRVDATIALGIPWAADNDCYQGLDPAAFVRMLTKLAHRPGCRFVSVPDVVGDAEATAASFKAWAPVIRWFGLPVALVAQDGLEDLRVPWGKIDALFLGGSTEWKLGPASRQLAKEALHRGKWVHMGRVNTAKRIDVALEWGCHSIDGTGFSMYYDTYVPKALEQIAAHSAKEAT